MPPHATSTRPFLRHRLTDLASDALDLLVPRLCAGCGTWGETICPDCALPFHGPLLEVAHATNAGSLPIHALAHYEGTCRTIILSWKNGSREDTGTFMSAVARRGGAQWARSLPPTIRQQVADSRGLLIIPAPSHWKRRLRGRLVAAAIADAVALGCAEALLAPLSSGAISDAARSPRSVSSPGPTTPGVIADADGLGSTATSPSSSGSAEKASVPPMVASADVLRRPIGAGGRHQSGRSSKARRANRSQPPHLTADVEGWCVLLVDDVVTTGATLASCDRALSTAGAHVLGALAVAATPPPASVMALPL